MGVMRSLFSGWGGIGCCLLRRVFWLRGLWGCVYGGFTGGCCYSGRGEEKAESVRIRIRGGRAALHGRSEYRFGGEEIRTATNSLNGTKCNIPRGPVLV